MKFLKWLNEHFEEVILVILLCLIVVVMTLQVFMRYVVGNALSFPEELCRYGFVWLSFIGISYSVRMGNSLKIDILETLLPKIKPYLNFFGNLVFLLFIGIMVWKGWIDISKMLTRNQLSPALGIPMWMVYGAFLAGSLLTVLRLVQVIITDMLNTIKKKKELSESELYQEGGSHS